MLTIEPVRKGESTELELKGKSEFKIGGVRILGDTSYTDAPADAPDIGLLDVSDIGFGLDMVQTISVDVLCDTLQDNNAAKLGLRERLVEEFDIFLKENGID
jgi:hypothetical protein|tara:strand:- start:253 stop:558 length:306 start_codon:yes stop_codon:yes gene_type:complete